MTKMTRTKFSTRQAALILVVAALIVSAGCHSLLTERSESTPTQSGTTTALPNDETTTETSNSATMRANGTDLRNVSVPDNRTETNTLYGEIDGGDPVIDGTNQYYEPILFTAEAGDSINVTMRSIAHDPELQLRAPNGTTIAVDEDGGEGNNARFDRLTLNEAGQYTLVATTAEANQSFDYTLRVDRYVEPNFNGPMSSWDEQSRYLEFAEDYLTGAQNLTGGPNGPSYATTPEEADGNLTAADYTVDTQEDYIIVRYAMEENATPRERVDIDAALMNAYYGLYDEYVESDSAENASWVPDRIYHLGYNYDGELYRTTYLEREWAVTFSEAGGVANTTAQSEYAALYLETLRLGPAHQSFAVGTNYSTTPSEAPVETYENFTIEPDVDGESPGGT